MKMLWAFPPFPEIGTYSGTLPGGGLWSLASEEIDVAALPVVGEGGKHNRLGVHHDHLRGVDAVVSNHGGQRLKHAGF